MVQDGLSQLGTSGDGTKIVYLTLALSVRSVNPQTHSLTHTPHSHTQIHTHTMTFI